MIAWIILEILIFCLLVIFILQENINGGKKWRFVLCCILIGILIMIPIITINEYSASKEFYYENITFVQQANTDLTKDQEYAILGRAITYNYKLYVYQDRVERFGIFAPEYSKIKNMPMIELKGFDMNHYHWWED